MAYSGIVLSAILREIRVNVLNSKILKVYQPHESEIRLLFSGREKHNLLISQSASEPRMYFTDLKSQNPDTPPTFCMVLRKHIESGTLLDVQQVKTDRIARLTIKSKDEMFVDTIKYLYIEIMGKYSNIILTDKDNKIIDSIKRVTPSISRVKIILPGEIYDPMVVSTGLDPTQVSPIEFDALLKEKSSQSLKNFFLRNFTGFSPQVIERFSQAINRMPGEIIETFTPNEIEILRQEFEKIQKILILEDFTPTLYKLSNGKRDFEAIDLPIGEDKETFDSMSKLLDQFYLEKSVQSSLAQKSNDLIKNVQRTMERTRLKLEKQSGELNEALDREKYKVYGDLISANLHNIDQNTSSVTVQNFYSEAMEEIEIPMDIKLSPAQNAQHYYKKYSKLKTGAVELKREIEKSNRLIEYLETVLLNIRLAKYKEDLEEIQEELYKIGILKKQKYGKKYKPKSLDQYTSPSGYATYVGRNNRQNEEITFKIARSQDTWFHIKEGPGAHVIVRNGGGPLTDEDIEFASRHALLNSDAGAGAMGEVVYTQKKYVKRHPSKIPGLVIYTDFKTVTVRSE